MASINAAFKNQIIELDVDSLKYTKEISPLIYETKKFKSIVSSIEEVGLVEPPVVYDENGTYTIMDGHLRIEALKNLRIKKVECLIAKEDEGYTYNKHISRIANIQEHKMILKAIEKGVPPERIAKALNIELSALMEKKNLLNGICPEVVELLKDKVVGSGVFGYLRKMKPTRQIEAVNHMIVMSDFSAKFARSLWRGTPDDQLVRPILKRSMVDFEKLARLENEVAYIENEFRVIEDAYGLNVLNLSFMKKYLESIMENEQINKFIKDHHADIYSQFNGVVGLDSLDGPI